MTPELRREVLADHARRRIGFRDTGAPGSWHEARLRSDTCGDDVTIRLAIADGRVAGVEWRGIGCEVSQASASMLAEVVAGRSVAELPALVDRVRALVSAAEGTEAPDLGDVEALAGIGRFPLRARCALLAWRAAEDAARTIG
jgi:nitrogen fixation NifU-like protein